MTVAAADEGVCDADRVSQLTPVTAAVEEDLLSITVAVNDEESGAALDQIQATGELEEVTAFSDQAQAAGELEGVSAAPDQAPMALEKNVSLTTGS